MSTTPILLVEDDRNSVFFFQHAAKKVGIANAIHVAVDGQEALDYLIGLDQFSDRAKFPLPSLVVLDLKMPRASGFDVLRHMRANPELRKIVVLMLTSSASDADIATAYDLGVNAYLVKPLRLEDLTVLAQSIKDFWLTLNHFAYLDEAPDLSGRPSLPSSAL